MKLTYTLQPSFPYHWLYGLIIAFALMMSLYFIGLNLPLAEARLGTGTPNYVRQTATHLSKLNGGVSVGGFPGFEPPKDDKDYQEKIKNRSYTAQDVNDWVREINNYLQQIIKQNPNMTLKQILIQLGLTAEQIDDFVENLQLVYIIIEPMAKFRLVNPVTFETYKEVLSILGVPAPW